MATKNPRVNVVLEPIIFITLKKLARHDGVSLSLMARDLIKRALEEYEDIQLAKKAEKREKTFSYSKALSHEKVWKAS